jgi:predicted GIY-YIG superfamily endonuclease
MRNDKGHFIKGHSGFRNSKYSDSEIIQEGEKYDSPSDFIKSNKTLYTYATKRGLTKKIKYKKGYLINYYTDEELIGEGEKYDNPTEFIKENSRAYASVVSRGLTQKINYKEGRLGNRLKRLVYLYIFSDNHFYVGITYNNRKREYEHSEKGLTAVSSHKRKTGLTPIKTIVTDGYINAERALEIEEQIRVDYVSKGWVSLNQRKCNSLGTPVRKWTEEKIRECISTCKFREEIKDKYGSGLYNAAHELGLWTELTKDMPYMINYYSKETAIQIASKYQTIQEFRNDYESLYVIISRNKWGKEVFKNMICGKSDYILDLNTGIFYYGYKDAINFSGVKLGLTGLRSQLSGRTTNKTSLIKT